MAIWTAADLMTFLTANPTAVVESGTVNGDLTIPDNSTITPTLRNLIFNGAVTFGTLADISHNPPYRDWTPLYRPRFEACTFKGIIDGTLDDSTWLDCNVNTATGGARLRLNGSRNLFDNLTLDANGSTTGLAFRANVGGRWGSVSHNIVRNSHISGATEENFALDGIAAHKFNGLVTAVTADSITVTNAYQPLLSGGVSAGDYSVGSKCVGMTAFVADGAGRCRYFEILAQNGYTFTLDTSKFPTTGIVVGDSVYVYNAFVENEFYNNVVESSGAQWNTSAMMLWGGCFGNIIRDNQFSVAAPNGMLGGDASIMTMGAGAAYGGTRAFNAHNCWYDNTATGGGYFFHGSYLSDETGFEGTRRNPQLATPDFIGGRCEFVRNDFDGLTRFENVWQAGVANNVWGSFTETIETDPIPEDDYYFDVTLNEVTYQAPFTPQVFMDSYDVAFNVFSVDEPFSAIGEMKFSGSAEATATNPPAAEVDWYYRGVHVTAAMYGSIPVTDWIFG